MKGGSRKDRQEAGPGQRADWGEQDEANSQMRDRKNELRSVLVPCIPISADTCFPGNDLGSQRRDADVKA